MVMGFWGTVLASGTCRLFATYDPEVTLLPMTLSDTEYQAILADTSKTIMGDIRWTDDEDHSPSVEFRAQIETEAGWPLFA